MGIVASVLHDYAVNEIEQPLTPDAVHLAGIVHDMGKILCATRGGAESYRTQDAVIELAKDQGDSIIFLYRKVYTN